MQVFFTHFRKLHTKKRISWCTAAMHSLGAGMFSCRPLRDHSPQHMLWELWGWLLYTFRAPLGGLQWISRVWKKKKVYTRYKCTLVQKVPREAAGASESQRMLRHVELKSCYFILSSHSCAWLLETCSLCTSSVIHRFYCITLQSL